jgi:hypothetical protein
MQLIVWVTAPHGYLGLNTTSQKQVIEKAGSGLPANKQLLNLSINIQPSGAEERHSTYRLSYVLEPVQYKG